ncbi:MAG: class I SAM-dependent methyltransferase [Gemmatimonadaceae bacterium]|nr:class I SAM-dependent methyltransferase [Gemmatimonadaceae bacterium]
MRPARTSRLISVVPKCPLCHAARPRSVESGDGKGYFACRVCHLIYLTPSRRLSAADERARYELHNNDRGDPNYVLFLRRLADPLVERLRPGARGLDFGCGPTPVLSEMLAAAGFPCAAYDPFFAPDETLLDKRYDFITCSEVVEHAHDPARMFATLRRMLAPGGMLGVMTMFYPGEDAFADWWYRRDPTHVCFYAEATMRWIGEWHGWKAEFPRPNVTLFSVAARP